MLRNSCSKELLLVLRMGVLAALASAIAPAVEFGRDIQPLLADRCFSCHGPDAAQRQAGLRLDIRSAALAPTASGRVPIQPGDPDASEVFRRASSSDPVLRMPPAYMGHQPLAPEDLESLRRWIEDGAEYRTHWAFVPPDRPASPATSTHDWPRASLDGFVLARLNTERLAPSAEATNSQWLRRMMLDLNGLPPTPADLQAFDEAVELRGQRAYEEAVDRVLSSPTYGERMAMDWLDVARYADTHGFNNDSARSMWRWRDWVIDAFNRNQPYDKFIVEQLAGDLLPEPTLEQRIATGFNRNHVINSEGGIIDEEYRVEYVADRVRTLGMAWLGLTFECARCHDHKFDPISQKDYYRLFAFFDNVPEIGEAGRVANAVPMIPAPTTEQRRQIAALHSQIDSLEPTERKVADAWEPSTSDLQSLVIPEYPSNADFFLGCEESDHPGIAGRGCRAQEIKREDKVKLEEHGAFTLSLWLHADDRHSDAPVFSAINYEPNPASTNHGNGIELRWIGGEIELRMSKRFPSYSMTVRSEGASLEPGQWRHVTALYEGSEGKNSMRAQAAWTRLFIDGREVATRVLHDDVQNGARFVAPYRLGQDNSRSGHRFLGRIDEVAIWKSALSEGEIRDVFEVAALPWARDRAGFETERGWLYRKLRPPGESEALRRSVFALRRSLPTTMVMTESSERRQSRLLVRGRYDSPGEPVQAGVPEMLLGHWPEAAPRDRLGLAMWLTAPRHPTTARVVVNRFWQQLFGVGLVKTSGDFGLQGETPSHPDLLDQLALDFIESGWDVKRLLRTIVLSATYRQDSATSPYLRNRDPENRLLARGPRIRLPAETIRDQALAIAGQLSGRVGGPSVHPYQPEGLYDGIVVGATYPGTTWEQDHGENLYRRSLYTFWKRTLPHPAMTVFDAPDREFCTVQRSTTNTPLQALTLMNDPTFVEAARKLAERVIRDAGPDPADRIALAFMLAAGRSPETAELAVLIESFERLRDSYSSDEDDARELLSVGESGTDATLDPEELAAYTALANLILNLDEVITKG